MRSVPSLLLRGYMGHWSALALLPLLALQVLVTFELDLATRLHLGKSGSISLGLVVFRDAFSLMIVVWLGVMIGAALRQELSRPGSSLLPGYARTNFRFAAVFSAIAFGFLLLLRVLAQSSLFGWTTLAVPALAGGLWIAWMIPGRGRNEVYQVVALFVAGLFLVSVLLRKLEIAPVPAWLVALPHAPLQLGSLLVGIAACALFVRKMSQLPEDSGLFRRRLNPSISDVCELDGGQSYPRFLLALMPPFTRTRVRVLPAVAFDTIRERVAQLRIAANVFNPIGLALMMFPWLLALTAFAIRVDQGGEAIYGMLLMLNAVPTVAANYARRRVRQEWMRPAPHEQILDALGMAASRDIAMYGATILFLQLLIQLILGPGSIRGFAFWGPYVASPGFLALATGMWLLLGSWTRWAGILVYLLVIPLSMIPTKLLQRSHYAENPAAWILLGLLAGLQLLWLVPVARRRWRRIEIGAL